MKPITRFRPYNQAWGKGKTWLDRLEAMQRRLDKRGIKTEIVKRPRENLIALALS